MLKVSTGVSRMFKGIPERYRRIYDIPGNSRRFQEIL
jgi:hypothetical protein